MPRRTVAKTSGVADFDPPPDHSFDYYFTLVLLSTHLNFSNEAFLPFIRNTELRHPRYLLYDLSTPQSLERNLRCLRSLGPGFSTTVNLDAFAHSRTTEAAARWVVDSITLNAYATATSNIKNAQPLNVQCERGYKFSPVTLKRKRVILSGRPNYSVWYGESEAFRLNVLIAEAKGGAKGSNPIPQLLGYMGCIRRERKNEQTRNWGVYGMAYTGSVWHLLKISHDSKWSESAIVGRRGAFEQPFGLLVWMLRRAAAISLAYSKETLAEIYSGVGCDEMDINPIAE